MATPDTAISPAAAFAARMRPVAAAITPYCVESIERYLDVGLTRPVFREPGGWASVADDGSLVIVVEPAAWAAVRAWGDRVLGMEGEAV